MQFRWIRRAAIYSLEIVKAGPVVTEMRCQSSRLATLEEARTCSKFEWSLTWKVCRETMIVESMHTWTWGWTTIISGERWETNGAILWHMQSTIISNPEHLQMSSPPISKIYQTVQMRVRIQNVADINDLTLYVWACPERGVKQGDRIQREFLRGYHSCS
jgi:hypothetical protein